MARVIEPEYITTILIISTFVWMYNIIEAKMANVMIIGIAIIIDEIVVGRQKKAHMCVDSSGIETA
jgi:hypothetical protein